jgi:hypothetical protein
VSRYEGTIVKAPFGPGTYLLETADGARYALKGGDEGLFAEGQKVSVQGELDGDAVGIGMTGDPVLDVSSYQVRD